jgi:hypothetical protein
LLIVALAASACTLERPRRAQAGLRAADPAPDAASTPPYLDFAVVGCPSYDPNGPSCTGAAPLDVAFTIIASAPPSMVRWSFGDGATADANVATVAHRYLRPGTYAVSVSAGDGATMQAEKPGYVIVVGAPIGAPCAEAAQCAGGVECVCAGGCQGVSPFCSRPCSLDSPCAPGAVCAALGNGAEPWQRDLCLPTCTKDSDCSPGTSCRELRGSPAGAAGWVKACFPGGAGADEGAPCNSADATPSDSRCAGGSCAPFGARGLCAATCDDSHPCPSYAACATFVFGDRRCLARCTANAPCTGDPWLDCEAPSSTGAYGFFVAESGEFCAPKRCANDAACGPDGACRTFAGSAFCVSK